MFELCDSCTGCVQTGNTRVQCAGVKKKEFTTGCQLRDLLDEGVSTTREYVGGGEGVAETGIRNQDHTSCVSRVFDLVQVSVCDGVNVFNAHSRSWEAKWRPTSL